MSICKDFMYNNCTRQNCRYVHDSDLCFYYWKNGSCKKGDDCEKKHTSTKEQLSKQMIKEMPKQENKENNKENDQEKPKRSKDKYNKELRPLIKERKRERNRIKNTECFTPMTKPVDIRISYDLGKEKLNSKVTSREVLLVPNLFSDFSTGEIYNRLVSEIQSCGIDQDKLLKMWHGDSHLIADDHLGWKSKCPTFRMIIDRIKSFFEMDVKATRFNWYTDTNQWKPFHHDAAAVKKDKMDTQNFTVGVSFGVTREAAFEHAEKKTTISIPQPDGCIYAFAKDTNIIWRHGILQDIPTRKEGRISIIAWGWIDDQVCLTPVVSGGAV